MRLNIMHDSSTPFTLRRGFLSRGVSAEGARWGEFTQSVANHVFGNIDRDVSASIMNRNGMSNHLRENHACATPCPQNPFLTFLVHCFNSLQKLGFYERTLFQ
jgi:hypothetical protein